jgi:MOSC domain-containing protein YiiM
VERACGKIASINVNPAGGVPKYAVPQARLTFNIVEGDKQRHLKFHGGPTRAVSLYSLELIHALQAEGHPIAPGTTGENLTISGLDWGGLSKGDQLEIGEALIEVAAYAKPCDLIAASFADGTSARIYQRAHPGWSRLYARVLREGTVKTGDTVIVTRPQLTLPGSTT